MLRCWVCGVVAVAVVFSSLGWSAPAMAKEKEPSDYYLGELLAGEAGLLGGGLIGLTIAGGISSAACEPGNTGCAMAAIAPAVMGGIIAGGFGTGLGVVLVGQRNGVAGNVGGAYVGSFLGIAVGLGMGSMLAGVAPPLALVALATPSVFSVIGYNIGAKMKDTGQPASLPWTLDLPVLSLEF